jgi:hypothetical protein
MKLNHLGPGRAPAPIGEIFEIEGEAGPEKVLYREPNFPTRMNVKHCPCAFPSDVVELLPELGVKQLIVKLHEGPTIQTTTADMLKMERDPGPRPDKWEARHYLPDAFWFDSKFEPPKEPLTAVITVDGSSWTREEKVAA